jgi:hypothetical protein
VVAYSQVNPEGHLYVFRTDGAGASRQLTSDSAIDRCAALVAGRGVDHRVLDTRRVAPDLEDSS